jgi:hypothetical protein
MAMGAMESWVTGRPGRKEGSHGAMSLPAMELGPENPRASPEFIKVSGFYWNDLAGEETPAVTYLPCLFRLLFSFEGEAEAAPHCGHSHILQSRGGGSKKQNNQKNHRQGPQGENPGHVQHEPPGGSSVQQSRP